MASSLHASGPAPRRASGRPADRGAGMTRGIRRALGGVAALALLVGVAVWRAHSWAEVTLERHRRALDADLVALRAVSRSRPALLEPASAGNAYDAYAPAITALTAPATGGGAGAGFRFPRAGHYLEVLDVHRADLARWDGALKCTCEAPPPPALGGPVVPALHAQSTSDAVTLQQNAVAEWVGTGRSDDALAAALRVIVLGADVRRSLGFLATQVGLSSEARGREMLSTVLRDGAPSAAALARAARVLEGLDAHRVSLEERLLAEAAFDRGARIASAEGTEPRSIVRDPLRGWRWLWSQRIFHATALDEGEVLRARTRTLLSRPLSTWRETSADVQNLFAGSEHPEFVAWATGSSEAWTFRAEARERMVAALDTVALAVARWVAERGSAPTALSDLAPVYLRVLPVCPASGEPLRYSTAPLRIWSIGGDGKDDGGRAAPVSADLDADGDFVRDLRMR